MKKTNNNKGFSLIELIVVIAIMAVLLAVLAPSLLGYVEKSRMQRDDSAMSEVVESFKLGLCDFDAYDEAYVYAAEGNYLTYTDSSGVYGQRITDEEHWNPDGSGKCLTITFEPEDGVYNIATAKINGLGTAPEGALQGEFVEMTHLYAKVKNIIGESLENVSATYENSSYTVFIAFDEVVEVYGQWNGTNLPEVAAEEDDSEEEGTALTGRIVNTTVGVQARQEPNRYATATTRLLPGTAVTVYEQKEVDGQMWGRVDAGWISMTYFAAD